MKRLLIILIVLALGVTAGVAVYLWFPTTPIYSLRQMRDAIQTHDWRAFTTQVDVDSVLNSASLDLAAIMQETMASKHISKVLTKSMGALIAIKVRTSLHEDLRDWVMAENTGRKGILGSLLPEATSGFKLRLKTIRWWGDKGRARVAVGPDTMLELELTKQEGAWRVSRVLNVRELYEKSRTKPSK